MFCQNGNLERISDHYKMHKKQGQEKGLVCYISNVD